MFWIALAIFASVGAITLPFQVYAQTGDAGLTFAATTTAFAAVLLYTSVATDWLTDG